MSLNHKKELVEIAKIVCRELRNNSTEAEKLFWAEVRNNKFDNKKFYRQYPFYYDITGRESFFVADFYCHKAKLVIELDGHQHKSNQQYDKDRTEIIEGYGLKVIRFENRDIDDNFEIVIKKLMKYI